MVPALLILPVAAARADPSDLGCPGDGPVGGIDGGPRASEGGLGSWVGEPDVKSGGGPVGWGGGQVCSMGGAPGGGGKGGVARLSRVIELYQ